VIRTFKHKGLAELWERGFSRRIDARLRERIFERLDALDTAAAPEEMNLPGFDFHGLSGFSPRRYTVHVNGPWCVTFAFDGMDAVLVDLEQYH
jgi:proteic killer suppression protein